MSEMIDRMAAAYWEGRQPTKGVRTPWKDVHPFAQDQLRLDAKYVLERMREPCEPQTEAGFKAIFGTGCNKLAADCWRAMIDEALKNYRPLPIEDR